MLERDPLPETPAARRGVPQGRCLHMLMGSGLQAFEKVLPGFSDSLVAAGAIQFDFGEEAALRVSTGWLPRFHAGLPMHACSRPLLESVLRQLVLGHAPVSLIQETTVLGLLAKPGGSRVTGVRVRGPAAGEERILEADLVVAAAGRGGALPAWLTALGLVPPDESVVEGLFHYTARWFAPASDQRRDWRLLSIAPAPGAPAAGLAFESEGRRLGVVLLSPREAPPPTTDEELLGCAAALADDRLAKTMAGAAALSPIHSFGIGRNRLRHLDRTAWPDGLVALGDMVLELDPYHGLGMSNAARAAVALAEFLQSGLGAAGDEGLALQFQAHLARTIADCWALAIDPAHPGQVARRVLQTLAPNDIALSRTLLHKLHGFGAALAPANGDPGGTQS